MGEKKTRQKVHEEGLLKLKTTLREPTIHGVVNFALRGEADENVLGRHTVDEHWPALADVSGRVDEVAGDALAAVLNDLQQFLPQQHG